MNTLIIKLGATGDVVRTTTLLNVLDGRVHWLTYDQNLVLLKDILQISQNVVPWGERQVLENRNYDLVINLEDGLEAAKLLKKIKYKELFGAYLNNSQKLTYTDNSKEWFDLSIISKYGKEKADELKYVNKKTYQELIFLGLGYTFSSQKYFLPEAHPAGLYHRLL